MPKTQLNSGFLQMLSTHRPSRGIRNFFDTDLTGFLVEVRPTGGATYYFRYRDAQQRSRQVRIGRVGEIDIEEARADAHRIRKMVSHGGDPVTDLPGLPEMPTFRRFVEAQYLPFAEARKRSWKTDHHLLTNHILPRLGDYRLGEVRSADLVAMHLGVKNAGYAAATANRLLVLTRFIFNCAIRWGVMPAGSNPATAIALFPDNGARERYLSADEIRRLFFELDRTPNQQVADIVRLLLYTGARRQEILKARWENVDFARRTLTVPLSKSGKPRQIALSDAAIAILDRYRRQDGNPWVFVNPRTGEARSTIFDGWDTIRKNAGLADLRLHDLRHSFASLLVNHGHSLYEVQRLLGHQSAKTTMRYAHLSPHSMLKAVNTVGDSVARANGGA
jgi:integrase